MESNSKSTDKLMALSHLIDKTIDKLPPDKLSKLKHLKLSGWILMRGIIIQTTLYLH